MKKFIYILLTQAYYDITITATTESGNTYSDVINNISVYGYVTIFTLDLDKIGYSFILSPNPVSDSFVSVSLKDSEMQINKSSTHTIQLWSSLGLVKTVQTDEPEYQLDLSGVAPGFYYVHVIKDGQAYRQQLVVR